MDDGLFLCTMPFRSVKPLVKITEPDNVNQLVGEHIYQQRQEFHMGIPAQGLQDKVILQADQKKVPVPGAPRPAPASSDALVKERKRMFADFVSSQGAKRFDVVTVPFPLVEGKLKIISRPVLRNFQGFANHLEISVTEKRKLHIKATVWERITLKI
jgi:hypothetical protein